MDDEERKPFWAKCQDCGHIWTIAYTPMMLTAMAKVLKGGCCPKCGADSMRITPAKQSDGKLLEPLSSEWPSRCKDCGADVEPEFPGEPPPKCCKRCNEAQSGEPL